MKQHTEELAKQGDVKAIEALINELLEPNGIKAKVGLKDSCLYVALASAQIPERQALVRCIGKRILQLGIKSLQSAKIYAAQWGQNLPVWQQKIPLNPPRLNLHDLNLNNHTYKASKRTPQQAIGKQLIVGNLTLQIDSTGIKVSPAKEQPQYQRSKPVFLLPDPLPNLIGRLPEIKSALASLEVNKSIEFYGLSGLGKSALLRHLIFFTQKNSVFTDGAVWLAHTYDLSDLLQNLFEISFESNIVSKPTSKEICRFLHDLKLLIFLDDTKLTPEDVKELHSILPNSCFILSSSSQKLFEGSSTQLLGLTKRDTVALITEQLHSLISTEELIAVEALAAKLSGNPYIIQLAVNCINHNLCTLRELVLKLQTAANNQVIEQILVQILEALPLPHQEILAVLATVDGVGLSEVQIEALSEVSDVPAILKALLDWNLVETQFDQYYLNKSLVSALQQKLDLTLFYEQALSYFTAIGQYSNSSNILNYPGALFSILTWAIQAERWESVLRLVKAIESNIIFSKRWGLWRAVLQYGLQASIALNDKESEAWMLHQLGSMALCLSNMTSGRKYLTKALQIRESLGLKDASTATRQNLHLVEMLPSEPETSITQFRVNYTSTDTKLQFLAVALIPLLCTVLTGLLAWYVLTHLLKAPTISKTINQPQILMSAQISSKNLNFGKQRVNSESKNKTITITNDGSVALRIAEIEKTGNQGDFEISNTTCTSTIPPNKSCNISIVFTPIEIGEHRASLPVTDSNGTTLNTIQIKGVAILPQPIAQDIPTAPKRDIQQPLPLSKPRLLAPQTPQIINPQPKKAIVAPAPQQNELPTELPPLTPELPTPTETPEVFPTVETTPEIIQTPVAAPDRTDPP
jgi:Abnormal spindle-like microcephaly-assoc'd, ASPM-SPD-2-Hydin